MARAHRLLPPSANLAMKLEEVSFDESDIDHPLNSAFGRSKTVAVFPVYPSCGLQKFAKFREQVACKLDPNFRWKILQEKKLELTTIVKFESFSV